MQSFVFKGIRLEYGLMYSDIATYDCFMYAAIRMV